MNPVAMTIAGSDPCGGAGLQADLKTFHQHGCYGTSVVTLLTAQNTCEVWLVEPVSVNLVLAQLESVIEDLPPAAAKTGALGNVELVTAIAERAAHFSFPLVVDPVMFSKHGQPLITPEAIQAIRNHLLPRATLLTPNLREAAELAQMQIGSEADMVVAAQRIAELGPQAVLVKGGPLTADAVDILWTNGEIHRFTARHLETQATHGTGCALSAAITAQLARGHDLFEAIQTAKHYVTEAIAASPLLGRGRHPINFHVLP